tara:strand:- start:1983 stop:2327 length:345 start_codon:yes stop_codon:yes gene_type:complete
MSKIKIVLILLLFFGFYKIYEIINTFKIQTNNKIVEYKDKAGIERIGNIIALLMFKGNQTKLIEQYPIKSVSQCINQRNYNRKKLFIKYQCADVEASIISGKIIKILKVNKILK